MVTMRSLLLVLCLGVVPLAHATWTPFFTNDRVIDDIDGMCLSRYTNRVVYCQGRLIEAVNYHRLYNDSKDFVDSPLKDDPATIVQAFEQTFPAVDITQIDPKLLRKFVDKYFDPPTSELIPCTPTDWTEQPDKIMQIQDQALREWALSLNGLWKDLCRQVDPALLQKRDRHSILYTPHPFIAPGGRFREAYYWDSYWIIRGLLISGMTDTARQMVFNFVYIIKDIGFIPNGLRIYYTNRSHPPLFAAMVYAIYEETQDIEFVKKVLEYMEMEFDFWESNRKFDVTLASGESEEVFYYKTGTKMPRPESMWADLHASDQLDGEDREFFFESAASAAEAGWDFSSRFFADRKSLSSMETVVIAPVDLNGFMCWNMQIMGYLYRRVGNVRRAEYFENKHANFIWTIDRVFYSHDAGGWFDFNNRTKEHLIHIYGSVAAPLFTNSYAVSDKNKPRRLFETLENMGFFSYAGGVPVSVVPDTKQQWDFPNGWAPLNHMIIEGLRMSSDPIMQDRAFDIATKWVHGNYKVYQATKLMFEKYNVIGEVPEPGGGGEYPVVTGFGWTNGAILDLLYTYYDRMAAPNENNDKKDPGKGSASIGTSIVLVLSLTFYSLFGHL